MLDKRIFKKLINLEQTVILAYQNGMTLTELAKLYKVSVGTIANLLEAHNIPRRPRGRRKKDADKQALQSNTQAS